MIHSWSPMEDRIGPVKVCSKNGLFANDSLSIDCEELSSSPKSDNEKTTDDLVPEHYKKTKFRRHLRSLREDGSDDSESLLASSEDQVDMNDDVGYNIVDRRKKHGKSKAFRNIEESTKSAYDNHDENESK